MNTATCKFENGKCLASITDNSVIMFGEIVGSYDKEIKTIATNFNEKKATCKIQNFYILLAFLLITIALFIAASIYCYLIKYWEKQKHLLAFHDTNNKLILSLYVWDLINR